MEEKLAPKADTATSTTTPTNNNTDATRTSPTDARELLLAEKEKAARLSSVTTTTSGTSATDTTEHTGTGSGTSPHNSSTSVLSAVTRESVLSQPGAFRMPGINQIEAAASSRSLASSATARRGSLASEAAMSEGVTTIASTIGTEGMPEVERLYPVSAVAGQSPRRRSSLENIFEDDNHPRGEEAVPMAQAHVVSASSSPRTGRGRRPDTTDRRPSMTSSHRDTTQTSSAVDTASGGEQESNINNDTGEAYDDNGNTSQSQSNPTNNNTPSNPHHPMGGGSASLAGMSFDIRYVEARPVSGQSVGVLDLSVFDAEPMGPGQRTNTVVFMKKRLAVMVTCIVLVVIVALAVGLGVVLSSSSSPAAGDEAVDPAFSSGGGPSTDAASLFPVHVISDSSRGAWDVMTIDFDQDGREDVITASWSSNEIVCYRNLGDGTLQPYIISSDCDLPYGIHAEDIDGDGQMDVVAACYGSNSIELYTNNGDWTFSNTRISSSAQGAWGVFAADVNEDGLVDVLSASSIDGKVVWHENKGDGSFISRTLTAQADGASSVTAADINGDGKMDIISASQNDGKIIYFENKGGGIFQTNIVSVADLVGASDVTAADVNNDGKLDIIACAHEKNLIVYFRNNGDGSFDQILVASDFDGPWMAYPADINGDGYIDIVSASYFNPNSRISYFENIDGGESFREVVVKKDVSGAASVAVADINGDNCPIGTSSARLSTTTVTFGTRTPSAEASESLLYGMCKRCSFICLRTYTSNQQKNALV